ncbi:hypothetical protein ACP70R_039091 [Stipagrostis hirtigluma subsp. patula]
MPSPPRAAAGPDDSRLDVILPIGVLLLGLPVAAGHPVVLLPAFAAGDASAATTVTLLLGFLIDVARPSPPGDAARPSPLLPHKRAHQLPRRRHPPWRAPQLPRRRAPRLPRRATGNAFTAATFKASTLGALLPTYHSATTPRRPTPFDSDLPLMGPGGRLFFSTEGTPAILFGSTSVQHQCIPQVTIGTDVTCQAKSGMTEAPRRKDSRFVKIKRNQFVVKFKVCCSKCTLSVFDAEKANKLK